MVAVSRTPTIDSVNHWSMKSCRELVGASTEMPTLELSFNTDRGWRAIHHSRIFDRSTSSIRNFSTTSHEPVAG